MARFRPALLAIAALTGLLLVIGVTAPASARAGTQPGPAATAPPPLPGWVPAPCADGAITEYGVHADPDGNVVMEISGWIQPCPGGSPTGFLIISYSVIMGTLRVRRYESQTSPTALNVVARHVSSLRTAVCLAFDTDRRLACLKIDPGGPGQLPMVAPTPTDDPRLLVPISPNVIEDTDPTCGTCV
jgi:hypothetical protein